MSNFVHKRKYEIKPSQVNQTEEQTNRRFRQHPMAWGEVGIEQSFGLNLGCG